MNFGSESLRDHLRDLLGDHFGEWIAAAVILVATYAAASLAQSLLNRLARRGPVHGRSMGFLARLAPSAGYLVLIVGLRAFADVAPLHPKLLVWIEHGTYIFTVLVLLGLARSSALLALEWSRLQSHSSQTLQQGFLPLFRNLITIFAFAMATIMILKHFNYDVFSLLTALGVGSLAVGLAAQATLSNMISGFVLIIDRNLKPGDRVNLAGSAGDIEEIGLRSTRIRMGDGNTLVVPNSDLANTKFMNLSMPSRAAIASSTLKVPYAVPFGRVQELAQASWAELTGLVAEKKPWVLLGSLADGYQTINVGFWVAEMDAAGGIVSEFNRKMLSRLNAEGIKLVETIYPPPSK